MHHTKIDLHIRKEPPNLLLTTTPNHHHHQLQIKIPSFPPPTLEFPSQYESFSKNQSTNKTHISTPHRRSIMSQSSNISPSSHPLKPKSSSIPVLLATRRITLKFIHHSCHPTWFKIHLKLLMLISLPFLYFFSSFFHIFCVVFLSVLLLISCSLALPRLPSFKLFLSRTSIKNHHHKHPVVWSIGSKAKSGKTERHTNSLSGVQVYSTGDVYEGEFHKGKCSGNGVYYYHMSGRYEGDWVNEKYDGYGVETWAKGSRYRGQYRQGLRQGVGVYRSFNGDFYSGEWCSGQCHGCGVYTCSDGSSYVGEFKWGVKHGLGHYHFRNGDMYAGEYFADKMHGFGVYTFGNGHRYEGAWHEGKRQGLGMYTFRNGDTQSGHWQNGILNVSTTQPTQPGSSPFSVDHLKVVNAVQEARQAAEKSFNVEKVDERVNRAVMAANKAATSARVAAVKAVQSRMYCNNVDVDTQIRVV